MEFVLLGNINFAHGTEFVRLTVIRIVLAQCGPVSDVFVHESSASVLLSFESSHVSQAALRLFDGMLLFGKTVTAHVSLPPLSAVPGFLVSTRPTTCIHVSNCSFFFVLVALRHTRGVRSVEPMDKTNCVVHTESAVVSMMVLDLLRSRKLTHRSTKECSRFVFIRPIQMDP